MILNIPSRGGYTHSVNTFWTIRLWEKKHSTASLSLAHCLPIRTYRTHASFHRAESLDDARDDDARDDDDDDDGFDDDGFDRARVVVVDMGVVVPARGGWER